MLNNSRRGSVIIVVVMWTERICTTTVDVVEQKKNRIYCDLCTRNIDLKLSVCIDLSDRFSKPVIIQQACHAGSIGSFEWLPFHLGVRTYAIRILQLDVLPGEFISVLC